jgi:MFS family permease
MFASLLLLPRYFQHVEGVSATHSGVLLYPLLIGLIVSVNVAGGMIAKRGEYRTVVLAGMVLLVLGAAGFATFDSSTPKWESLTFMALIGLGVGPQLSGLQIAMMRTLEPHRVAGGLGSLMLLRQVGAAVALAAAETLYLRGDDPAVATGTSIVVIAVAGAVIASAALLSVPRPATRFAMAA